MRSATTPWFSRPARATPTSATMNGRPMRRGSSAGGCDVDPPPHPLVLGARGARDRPGAPDALLTFVVVGGGPTGVELAGAIAELDASKSAPPISAHRHARGAGAVDRGRSAHSAELHGRSSPPMRSALERLGVDVQLGSAVSECIADGVVYGGRRVAAESSSGEPACGRRRPQRGWARRPTAPAVVRVDADLTAPGHPEIFVVGDTATVDAWEASPSPASRRPRSSRVCTSRDDPPALRGELLRGRFAIVTPETLRRSASAPRSWTSAGCVRGWIAWWVWGLAHIYFLIGFRNRLAVALSWLWIYTTGNRTACLITQGEQRAKTSPPPPRFRCPRPARLLSRAVARAAGSANAEAENCRSVCRRRARRRRHRSWPAQ